MLGAGSRQARIQLMAPNDPLQVNLESYLYQILVDDMDRPFRTERVIVHSPLTRITN